MAGEDARRRLKTAVGEWILSTALSAAAPALPIIADAIEGMAPDTRTGGDQNLSSVARSILIDGGRRDSGVEVPVLDPTPDSDQGKILGGVEEWRAADDVIADQLQDKLEDILDPDGWSPQGAWDASRSNFT